MSCTTGRSHGLLLELKTEDIALSVHGMGWGNMSIWCGQRVDRSAGRDVYCIGGEGGEKVRDGGDVFGYGVRCWCLWICE